MNKHTGLLLIDIQEGFGELEYWGGHRNNLDAEQKSARILKIWRNHSWPIFHIKHNSTDPNSPLFPGKQSNLIQKTVEPLPSERVIEKTVNSAFIGTNLETKLRAEKLDSLVIVGLTTDHCISTSVRMSANLGFSTTLVEDATATFDKVDRHGNKFTAEEIQAITIASLQDEFAKIMTTEELIDSLAQQNTNT